MRNVLQILTPEHVILKFELAGVGSRGVAAIIDTLIQYVLLAMIAVAMFLIAGEESLGLMFAQNNTLYIVICLLFIFVIQFGYFLLFEYVMKGMTPGKKAVGLKVMMVNGEPASLTALFIRNLIRIADMLPLFYFVGIFSVIFTKHFMRVGDLAANTVVVKIRKEKKNFKTLPRMMAETVNLSISPKEKALLTEYQSRRTDPKNPLVSNILEAQLYHYFYQKIGLVPELPDRFTHRIYLDKLIMHLGIPENR